MPPFQWQAPPSLDPNGNIAALMLRGPDALAAGQIEAARANAAGIANSGAIMGNAIAGAGQEIARVPAQIQQQKAQQQESEARALALAEAKQRYAGGQAVDTMMKGSTLKPGDQGPTQQNPFLTADGLYDVTKMSDALSKGGYAHLAPDLLKGAENLNDSIVKQEQHQQQAAQSQTLMLGDMADGASKLVKLGMPIDQALDFVSASALYKKLIQPDQYDQIKQRIVSLPPDQQEAALNSFRDAAAKLDKGDTLASGAVHVDRYGRTESSNPKPQAVTEASIALAAAHGDPLLAMHMLKPGERVKPGTQEDWVDRARRLAVSAQDGKPLTDAQTQAIDTKAINQFHEINTDPEMRAASLAQKNLAQVLTQLQLGQQPTKDDAALIAKQVLNHQMAPSQAMAMGGYGTAGSAFKRMIGVELAKEDPSFSWEQAQADYDFSKTPSFQNTVRFMDSTLESMPRLLQNAKALAQGQVQSINKLVADGKQQLNNVDLKKFKTDAIFVGDEIAKILQGGGTGSGTSDAKLKQAQEIFSTSDNPATIAAALEESTALLGNRRTAVTRGTFAEKKNGATLTPPPTVMPGLTIERGKP